MAIVRMTSEEIKKIMTPERIAEEREMMKHAKFVYDPECPPCSEEKLKRFRRVSELKALGMKYV